MKIRISTLMRRRCALALVDRGLALAAPGEPGHSHKRSRPASRATRRSRRPHHRGHHEGDRGRARCCSSPTRSRSSAASR